MSLGHAPSPRLLALVIPVAMALAVPAHADGPSLNPSAAPDGTYALEPTHTRVSFLISHLGLSQYTAWIEGASGTLQWNGQEPAKSSLAVTLDAAGVTTGLPKFDEELEGADFFDAATHPEITFVSKEVTVTGETTGTVTGDLTFRGVTKPMTLDVTFNGSIQHPIRNTRAMGFSATGSLKRSDFGLTKYLDFGIGDEVQLLIQSEFLQDQ
ncbi:MAG: polyisoprenoid-binding protein [Alphaproteobacteria bacterium]|nr:polyisoprenoid-binding protein [Alphaproteobacteria bacterium]